jgi:hypothetical protein
MARYNGTFTSSTGLASGSVAGWLGYSTVATTVFRLRHVNAGVINAGGTIVSEQISVGINVTTGSPATPTATALNSMDAGCRAAGNGIVTAWTTAPTLATNDAWTIPGNDQLLLDQLWELLSEFRLGGSATTGIAFVNRSGAALPAAHQFQISVEIEE